MLATWLVEFYLSKCDELDDLCAADSSTSGVENVQAERAILEEDLRHFFETYKVNWSTTPCISFTDTMCRPTLIGILCMSSSKAMGGQICYCSMRQLWVTLSALSRIGSWTRSGLKLLMLSVVKFVLLYLLPAPF